MLNLHFEKIASSLELNDDSFINNESAAVSIMKMFASSVILLGYFFVCFLRPFSFPQFVTRKNRKKHYRVV